MIPPAFQKQAIDLLELSRRGASERRVVAEVIAQILQDQQIDASVRGFIFETLLLIIREQCALGKLQGYNATDFGSPDAWGRTIVWPNDPTNGMLIAEAVRSAQLYATADQPANLTHLNIPLLTFADGETIRYVNFSGSHIAGFRLIKGSLADVTFDDAVVKDAQFVDCALSQMRAKNASWYDFSGRNSSFVGCSFDKALFESARFTSCHIVSHYSNAYIRHTKFIDCHIKSADFRAAILRRSQFIGTTLESCEFGFVDFDECVFVEDDPKHPDYGGNATRFVDTKVKAHQFSWDCVVSADFLRELDRSPDELPRAIEKPATPPDPTV